MNGISKFFKFDELQTTFGREIVAGLTTFLAMAYILFVNPTVLGAAGMDKGAVFTATAISSAFGCIVMGLLAKYPIAIAPGLGVNAFFAFSVVIGMKIPWQTALAGVLLASVIFLIITLFKIREMIINAIPQDLKLATAAGIGLFIAFIGLKGAGLIVANKATTVALGSLTKGSTLLAIFGLLVTIILIVRNIKGAIFIGMILTSIIGLITGLIPVPTQVISTAPSLAPTFGQAIFHLSDINTVQLAIVVLTFLLVTFFDTAGTIVGVAEQAGFLRDNKLPRAGQALLADSSSMFVGAILGTSPTSAYIESSAGIGVGGRSGLTAVVTGILFIFGLLFSPLLAVVTEVVTAPALIIVGIMMAGALGSIDWKKMEIAIPAFFTVIAMPLTYSISTGVALGFFLYPITMIVKGRAKAIHPIMYVLFFIFIIYFYFLSLNGNV